MQIDEKINEDKTFTTSISRGYQTCHDLVSYYIANWWLHAPVWVQYS